MTMALAAAPYVVWMIATAEQCQAAAVGAARRRPRLRLPGPVWCPRRYRREQGPAAALLSTNFMGFNTPAIMANEAITVRCGPRHRDDVRLRRPGLRDHRHADPFTSPAATLIRSAGGSSGALGNRAARGRTATDEFRQQRRFARRFRQPDDAVDGSAAGQQHSPSAAGAFLTVEWRLGSSGLGQFQSLLSPFMSFMNPGMFGSGGASAATSAGGPDLRAGRAASEVEAVAAGRARWRVVGAGDLDAGSVESTSTARAVAPCRLGWGHVCGSRPSDHRGLGMYGGRRWPQVCRAAVPTVTAHRAMESGQVLRRR